VEEELGLRCSRENIIDGPSEEAPEVYFHSCLCNRKGTFLLWGRGGGGWVGGGGGGERGVFMESASQYYAKLFVVFQSTGFGCI